MRARVVEAARGWLGTPYLHQASVRGAGCDCLGLLRGVWREVLGTEPELPPAYGPGWDEVQGGEVLRRAAERHLNEIAQEDAGPGDVLLFRMRRGAVAKHLGILTDTGDAPRFVHAYTGHGVVECALSAPWRARLDGIFALPQSTDLQET